MKTVFGNITDHEVLWLNQELKKVGFNKTVDLLKGIPAFGDPEKRGSLVYPFVHKFFETRKARQSNWDQILKEEN